MLVHRYWHGKPNPLHKWTGRILQSLGHEVKEWTDETIPGDVIRLIHDSSIRVREADRIKHRSNVVRWWALFIYGGWWADSDLIPLRPFTELPQPGTAAHGGVRCTSWLAFPPRHEVPQAMLTSIGHDNHYGQSSRVSGEWRLNQICPFDIPAIDLPINSHGGIESTDNWAIHLYNNHTGVC